MLWQNLLDCSVGIARPERRFQNLGGDPLNTAVANP
jgi:hypothetical protein